MKWREDSPVYEIIVVWWLLLDHHPVFTVERECNGNIIKANSAEHGSGGESRLFDFIYPWRRPSIRLIQAYQPYRRDELIYAGTGTGSDGEGYEEFMLQKHERVEDLDHCGDE